MLVYVDTIPIQKSFSLSLSFNSDALWLQEEEKSSEAGSTNSRGGSSSGNGNGSAGGKGEGGRSSGGNGGSNRSARNSRSDGAKSDLSSGDLDAKGIRQNKKEPMSDSDSHSSASLNFQLHNSKLMHSIVGNFQYAAPGELECRHLVKNCWIL